MKKLIGVLSIILAISLAPGITQAQVDFGIRGGVNFATLNGDNIDVESRIGFLAGVYMNYDIPNNPFSIQPEVLYTQKGAENSGTIEGQEITQTLKLAYIEIPVLVKYEFMTGRNLSPHIYVGPCPYLGINVNTTSEFESGGNSNSEDLSEEYKNTDFGLAGIDINRFNIGVRYSLGLSDITEEEDTDFNNRVISIVADFEF